MSTATESVSAPVGAGERAVSESGVAHKRRHRGGQKHRNRRENTGAAPRQAPNAASTDRKVAGDSERPSATVRQLRDIFPDWTVDDLQVVLAEASNDVERVIQRISTGHVSHWQKTGEPVRKPVSEAAVPRVERSRREQARPTGEARTRPATQPTDSVRPSDRRAEKPRARASDEPAASALKLAEPAVTSAEPAAPVTQSETSAVSEPVVVESRAVEAKAESVLSLASLSIADSAVVFEQARVVSLPVVEMPRSLSSRLASPAQKPELAPVVVLPSRTTVNPGLCVPLCVSPTTFATHAAQTAVPGSPSVPKAAVSPPSRYTSTGVEAILSSPRRNADADMMDIGATIRRPNAAVGTSQASAPLRRQEQSPPVQPHQSSTLPPGLSAQQGAPRRTDYQMQSMSAPMRQAPSRFAGQTSSYGQDASIDTAAAEAAEVAAQQQFYAQEQSMYAAQSSYGRGSYHGQAQQPYYRGEGGHHMRYNGTQQQFAPWSGYGNGGMHYQQQYPPQQHGYDHYTSSGQARYTAGGYGSQQPGAYYGTPEHAMYGQQPTARMTAPQAAPHMRRSDAPQTAFSNAFAPATAPSVPGKTA